MSRFFIFLQYKGTVYHGWQKQPNAHTVQQVVDEKLTILLREKIETTGAGRTDTGVHAKEFAAHFDTDSLLPENKVHFLFKINCLLPPDITVYNISKVKPGAHARFDAISRTYEYHIVTKKDPFNQEYAYYYPWKLNIMQMNVAGKKIMEFMDFTSFSKLHTDVKTNNCKITEAYWQELEGNLIFTVSADRFLRNMVRAIVGTMLDIGRQKISIDDLCRVIEAKNRGYAGISAPAHGLFLTRIIYPPILFDE